MTHRGWEIQMPGTVEIFSIQSLLLYSPSFKSVPFGGGGWALEDISFYCYIGLFALALYMYTLNIHLCYTIMFILKQAIQKHSEILKIYRCVKFLLLSLKDKAM